MTAAPKPGDEHSFSRMISREDILEFARVSHDHGAHHMEGEKLLAHGLLVATLPTKLGGDLNYIAAEMRFEFVKAVYENEIITCKAKVEKVIEQSRRFKCRFSFVCYNENNQPVLIGHTNGMIWKT